MAGRNSMHVLPTRPPLSSHQSNSVPSTPHQHARDFRSRSRSPSPHAGLGLGSHSPRSVKSEANHGPMTTLPKGRPTCKYETSAAFSRRRMQYDIGDAPLEKPTDEVKQTLDPHEENKLSGDMRELYDRIFPSDESNERRMLFVKKLEDILRKEWPDAEFKVHIFGSHANSLCTSESDVDICIQTPMKKLETMHILAEALANNGMERVICIAAAKVPIVKIWDPVLKVAADMNVNNTLALENTRMIRSYVTLDERVRPLGLMIKHWAKQRILNDAGIGGTLSSYAWTCMILYFLQTRKPPILPSLHQLPHEEYVANDGTESGFSNDLESLRDFSSANNETIGELLFHFFRTYAYEFDYDKCVVSVRQGKLLTRKEKGWDMASKEGQWRLCIEEPFNITRNLGNSADSTAFRGIHLELRRAFNLLAEGGQLEKCCEPYQFPVVEKDIFKKPVAGPKPVLSAIPTHPARSGRIGSSNARNGRHNNGNNGSRNAASYRRSSSGASFGRPHYSMQSPPLGASGSDYVSAGLSAASLQDQLLQQSQLYGIQIEQLKARMAFQANQIQAAEQTRLVSATAHAHALIQGSNQTSRDASATVSPQKTPFLTGTNSQGPNSAPFYHEYLYHPYDTQLMSQDGSRTNPSSPSLSTSTPARRTMQRSSLANDGQGGSTRSQSQPPRGVPQPMVYPLAHYIPGYGMYYATASSAMDPPHPQSSLDVPVGYDISRTTSLPIRDGSPKEYVGYHFQVPRVVQQASVRKIPTYSELAHRRNQPSQEINLLGNGEKRLSRSPSPLRHQRAFSTSHQGLYAEPQSAPLPVPVPLHQRDTRIDPTQRTGKQAAATLNGLLIVNGSSYPSSTVEIRSNASEDDSPMNGSGSAFIGREEPFRHDDLSASSGGPHSVYDSPALSQQYSPPSYQGGALNGFSSYPAPFETENVPPSHSPVQPFPSFIDPGLSSSSSHEDEETVAPKSVQPSAWRVQLPAKTPVPPIDTSQGQDVSKNHEPKTAPLLSPVYETRTPSPTAHRRSEHMPSLSLNGISPIVNGFPTKGSSSTNGRAHGTRPGRIPLTPVEGSDGATHQQIKTPSSATSSTTGWQSAGGKKSKKNKQRSHSKSTSAGNSNAKPRGGEPMPANASERKGG